MEEAYPPLKAPTGLFTGVAAAVTASWNRLLVDWNDLDWKGVAALKVLDAEEKRGTRRRDAMALTASNCEDNGSRAGVRSGEVATRLLNKVMLFGFGRIGKKRSSTGENRSNEELRVVDRFGVA